MEEYTTGEAADYLGVSVRRVQALIKSGYLRAEPFGKAWSMREEDLKGMRSMLEDKGHRGPGRPSKPLKVFGEYALAEFRQGTLIRTPDGTTWLAGLRAPAAIEKLEGGSSGSQKGKDWKALCKYGSA
jgi:excisionase family DNA binding protein